LRNDTKTPWYWILPGGSMEQDSILALTMMALLATGDPPMHFKHGLPFIKPQWQCDNVFSSQLNPQPRFSTIDWVHSIVTHIPPKYSQSFVTHLHHEVAINHLTMPPHHVLTVNIHNANINSCTVPLSKLKTMHNMTVTPDSTAHAPFNWPRYDKWYLILASWNWQCTWETTQMGQHAIQQHLHQPIQ